MARAKVGPIFQRGEVMSKLNNFKPHSIDKNARRLLLDSVSGGLCLAANVGQSFFVETEHGPLQIQIIQTRGAKVRVRFSSVPGKPKPLVIRETVVREIRNGSRLNESNEAGVTMSPFIKTVLSHVVEV